MTQPLYQFISVVQTVEIVGSAKVAQVLIHV
jgi:hypothetical protein